jgi:hypothetical protein
MVSNIRVRNLSGHAVCVSVSSTQSRRQIRFKCTEQMNTERLKLREYIIRLLPIDNFNSNSLIFHHTRTHRYQTDTTPLFLR